MPIKIALFKNEKKENESQPDYTGYNNQTGDSAAGWIRTARNEEKSQYISLSIETKEEKEERMRGLRQEVESPKSQSFDELPF